MNNGHFSRQGQHGHKNRNRNRNRRHGGGQGGGGGGSGGNRVLDSNGPDVKLRGTAQTIAEKYMQLGRDAQLSGDNVMAESYYQHGEHYYRLWLAAQPAGQPIQFLTRRPGDDESEDDSTDVGEAEDEVGGESPAEGVEGTEAIAGSTEGEVQGNGGDQRPNRPRDQQRDGNREKFRPRWPRRQDRPFDNNRSLNGEAAERPEPVPVAAPEAESDPGNWETPSFLTRPVQAAASEGSEPEAEAAPERRPRREFRPRRPREAKAVDAGDTPVSPVEGSGD